MQLSVVGAAALAVWSKPIPWLPRAHCDGGSEPLRSAQLHAHRHDQTQEQRDPVLQSEEDLREFNVSWGEKRKNQIIFIGSGSSSGIPRPYCLMHPEDTSRGCIINRMAADPSIPSYANPNRRGNPSLLIRWTDTKNGNAVKHIQIDTGKTFYQGVVEWFPKHRINSLDAIVLTHDHADAVLGLDDVRGLQSSRGEKDTRTPVWLDDRTYSTVQNVFPYLCPKHIKEKAAADDECGRVTVKRHVAALDYHVFEHFKSFSAAGLEFTPVPVWHGDDYISNGFIFGAPDSKVVYISDVSRIPPATLEYLQGLKINILVVDSLLRERTHITHFSIEQAVALARQLKAKQTFLVGMSADIEHYETSRDLLKLEQGEDPVCVRLARDGLAVDF